MFNLIRKDMIVLKTTILIFIPVLFAYLVVDAASVLVGVFFSLVIIIGAFGTDEKPAINNFLNSLPYTRKEIVSSKYIGALIFTFIIVFVLFIGNLIIYREIIDWKEALLIVGLVLLFVSFYFPFSYKFKGQYFLNGTLVIGAAALLVTNFILPKLGLVIDDRMNIGEKIEWIVQKLFTLQDVQLYGLIAIVIIVLYACSWLLSIRIYSKKVF